MNKKLRKSLLLSLGIFAATTYANRPIQVATFVRLPPFSFTGKSSPEGFDVDLIKAVARKEKLNIAVQGYPFNAMKEGLNSGQVDLIVSGLLHTPKRAEEFEISKPYSQGRDALLYINSDIEIKSDEDVKKLKIATLENSAQSKALLNVVGVPRENLIFVKTTYLGYRALVTKEADALATYDLALRYLVKNKEGDFKFYTLQSIEPRKIIAIAKKGNQELIHKFNRGIEEAKKDGTYQRIYKKWFGKS